MSQPPKLDILRDSKKNIEKLNSFEFRENLLRLTHARHAHIQRSMFDSERGNPNWTALAAREAHLALGMFAFQECSLDLTLASGLGGVPQRTGIATRFYKFLQKNKDCPGIGQLTEMYKYYVHNFGDDIEELIFELGEGIAGCQSPHPIRMLHHCEKIVRAFLIRELCGGEAPENGFYDIFAVEDSTSGLCYVINSLVNNKLLRRGDKIALAVPLLKPYAETVKLEKFGFDVVYIKASGVDADGNPNYQYPDSELDKLADPSIKAFSIMDPANPTSVAMEPRSRDYIVGIVKEHNPGLIVIAENTYAQFASGFRSLAADLPRNTLAIYSYSKFFGCTGWRVGAVMLHEDNIIDEKIALLPAPEKENLEKLYAIVTDRPENMKFIDRMVADSLEVTLAYTAGLSAPQQVQMAIMSGFALVEHLKGAPYKKECAALLQKRYDLFWEGMGIIPVDDPNHINFYCSFDIARWAVAKYGVDFFAWLDANFKPKDIVYRVAEVFAVIFLNGETFGCPEWSVRVSLASLDSDEYKKLGTMLIRVLEEYADAWKADSPSAEIQA